MNKELYEMIKPFFPQIWIPKILWWIHTIILYVIFDAEKAKTRLAERRACINSCKRVK